MLATEIKEENMNAIHSAGDADLLIVQAAIKSAKSKPIVIIADDTDLVILLLIILI